jgi:hypothetical protein
MFSITLPGLRPNGTGKYPVRLEGPEGQRAVYFDAETGLACDSPNDDYCMKCSRAVCSYREKLISKER